EQTPSPAARPPEPLCRRNRASHGSGPRACGDRCAREGRQVLAPPRTREASLGARRQAQEKSGRAALAQRLLQLARSRLRDLATFSRRAASAGQGLRPAPTELKRRTTDIAKNQYVALYEHKNTTGLAQRS